MVLIEISSLKVGVEYRNRYAVLYPLLETREGCSMKRRKKVAGVHISVVPSKREGKTYYCTLVRQSFRDKEDSSKVRKRTLANITHLPEEAILLLKDFFKGKNFVQADSKHKEGPMELLESLPHGHVDAVLTAFRRLEIPSLISSKPSEKRDLICALIASRILRPESKLATTGWWQYDSSTLADEYPVIKSAGSDDVYRAMDDLLKRQDVIQKKLARRLLSEGGTILYDLSSSYFEGKCCPMARYGYSRDRQPGKLQVNYGLLCDARGRPVAITCHEGNVHDAKTLMGEVHRLQKKFNLSRVLIVGDRGMITGAKIKDLQKIGGIEWITALRKSSIGAMLTQERLDVLDETHICEWDHPDYPGERLIACYNEPLAAKLSHDRESLLLRTEEALNDLKESLDAKKKKLDEGSIGIAMGKILGRYKVGKYFNIEIKNKSFCFVRDQDTINKDQQRDGIYVIRTSLAPEEKDSFECVRTYKSLAKVEGAFRILKSELRIRPIHHWKVQRVKAHLFLCMLAYYVEWHMRKAWGELLFSDVDLEEASQYRHPVYCHPPGEKALEKKQKKKLPDGTPVCKFRVLLDSLSCVTKCTYRIRYESKAKKAEEEQNRYTFQSLAGLDSKKQKMMDLLQQISDHRAS